MGRRHTDREIWTGTQRPWADGPAVEGRLDAGPFVTNNSSKGLGYGYISVVGGLKIKGAEKRGGSRLIGRDLCSMLRQVLSH